MPQDFLAPRHHLESLVGYATPESVRRDFPDGLFYEVELSLRDHRVLCRCGEAQWSLSRQGHTFVCECTCCGSATSFGAHCFALFDVTKAEGGDIIDLVDVQIVSTES